MGTERLVTLLSWVPTFFGPTFRMVFEWRSKQRTESGTQERGLRVQVWTEPGPLDRRVMGWSYLCLGYKRGVCFGVPS